MSSALFQPLESEDVSALDSPQRVARIDDQRASVRNRLVVEALVMGRNYRTVNPALERCFGLDPLQHRRTFPKRPNVRIGIRDDRTTTMKESDDVEGWRFAHIADVWFVSNAEQVNPRSSNREALAVERT